MGSTPSKIKKVEDDKKIKNNIKEEALAKSFLSNLLRRRYISHVTKIVKVHDFFDPFGPVGSSYSCHSFNSCFDVNYSLYEYETTDINSDLAIKVKNIICILRVLIMEHCKLIYDSINTIDISIKNYNEIENNNNIEELNKLLKIENSKINTVQLDDISLICENIFILREKLDFLENNRNKFRKEIEDKNELKIQLTNIYLFLKCTDHLFLENNCNPKIITNLTFINDENTISEVSIATLCEPNLDQVVEAQYLINYPSGSK